MLRKTMFVMLFLMLFSFALMASVGAQSTPVAPETTAESVETGPMVTSDPTHYARLQQSSATLHADLTSRSTFDYPTAYLITDSAAAEESLFTVDTIIEMTGALVFNTYADFAEYHAETPFEVVLLHPSIYDEIDPQWAAAAFRDRLIFFGFDISMAQWRALFDNDCFGEHPSQSGLDVPKITGVQWVLRLEDMQFYDAVKADLFDNCGANGTTIVNNHTGMYGLGFNVTSMPLLEDEWLGTLPIAIISATHLYGLPNRSESE